MYKKTYFAVLLTICTMLVSERVRAQITFPSFVQETVPKVEGIKTDSDLYKLSPLKKTITRTFLDGLGRPVQQVAVMASPSMNDIVQVMGYNSLGQQTKSYLPYAAADGSGSFRANGIALQSQFYANGASDKVADDNNPFSQQVFENSPLQRVLKAGGIGTGYQPDQHYQTANYRSNTSGDNVRIWIPGSNISSGTFAAAKLNVAESTDADGKQVMVFTNDAGQTILKRQYANEVINSVTETYFDTYYLYNENGSVSYIVPPKATAQMKNSSSWDISQTGMDKLLFKFSYDDEGRLITKRVPGAGDIYIVYDPLERPVLLQDANMRSENKWNYIKYDMKGRAISHGIYTDAVRTTLSAMQTYVNGLTSYSTYYCETRSTSAATGYYTNNCFPTTGTDPLAYSYYDDYDLDKNGTPDYNYANQSLAGEATATTATRGMLTMVRKRTVGSGLTATWLINIVFYDKRGNTIQQQGNNHLTSTVSDITTNVPDFTGKVMQAKVVKVAGSITTTVVSNYTYDHADRMIALNQSYNGGAPVRVAAYEYNELGQLVKKKLHGNSTASSVPANVTLNTSNNVSGTGTSTVTATTSIDFEEGFEVAVGGDFTASISSGSYLQNVDYRYNIRGQLTSINNSTLTNDGGIKNEDTNDVFGLELLFDQVDGTLSNSAYYNGRLSALRWMSKDGNGTNGNERSYKYNYDNLNRLKDALYADRTSGGAWARLNAFDEKNITYDHNGNILALQRNALISGATTQVDNLSYTYDGNRLMNVADGAGSNYTGLGFKNLTGSTNVYTYDDNGNLKADPKKGIALDYNVLNRTDRITITTNGNYITYTYDAGGVLLRKQQFNSSNVLQKTTDYSGGFVYENSTLAYFGMPEGRVRNNSGTLKSEYMITDHQGNVRVSFEDNGSGVAVVKQENSYYPFGLVMNGSTVPTPTAANKNLYNGASEWQNDFGDLPDYYNTFYRNYDAAIGRFVGVDPLAEAADEWTTYQYGYNSPGVFNDPLGDAAKLNAGNGQYADFWNQIWERSAYGDFEGKWHNEGDGYWGSSTGRQNFYAFSSFNETTGGYDYAFGNVGLTLTQGGSSGSRSTGPSYNPFGGSEVKYVNGRVILPGRWTGNSIVGGEVTINATKDKSLPWYEFFSDHQPGGDFAYEFNKTFNPIAGVLNLIYVSNTGKDSYGVPTTKVDATANLLATLPIFKIGKITYAFGAYKSSIRWSNQILKRGWTITMVDEALQTNGIAYNGVNHINPGNPLKIFVHPTANRGVIVDDVTKEIIQLTDDLSKWAH